MYDGLRPQHNNTNSKKMPKDVAQGKGRKKSKNQTSKNSFMMSMETGKLNLLGTPGGPLRPKVVKEEKLYKDMMETMTRVTDRRHGLVMCDYPEENERVTVGVTGFSLSTKSSKFPSGAHANAHRFIYLSTINRGSTGNQKALTPDDEVYRKCGNKFCCRMSHLIAGYKVSTPRKNCLGFIRFGSNDKIAMVCPHKSDTEIACPIVIDHTKILATAADIPTKKREEEGCYGFIKYGDIYARACTHTPPCSTVTNFEDISVDATDVDPPGMYDNLVTNTMSSAVYKALHPDYDSDGEGRAKLVGRVLVRPPAEPEQYRKGTRRSTRNKK